ncbi:Protein sel-1 1 [Linnemannia zychae]|nr:Protein sel-1 1 [Linnemannia zychae]
MSLQAVRRVYEDDINTPKDTSASRVLHIRCHSDPASGKDILLWDDILAAFKGNVIHVLSGTVIVPFLKGSDFKNLDPLRIAAQPDITFDIVMSGNQLDSLGLSLDSLQKVPPDTPNRPIQTNTSTPVGSTNVPIRRNPAGGLVEAAMDAYRDNENPVFAIARAPQAVQGDQPSNSDASREFKPNHVARVALGDMYMRGQGVDQNIQKAIDWYLAAAGLGSTLAEWKLQVLCYSDIGFTQDCLTAITRYREIAVDKKDAKAQRNIGSLCFYAKVYTQAMSWYTMAAEQGDAVAQYQLGVMYDQAIGVTQDVVKAMAYYKKAAERDNASALCGIGYLHHRGLGVPKSHTEAMNWYQRAAHHGSASALSSIGYLYERGYGVAQSLDKARSFYHRAAEQDNSHGQNNLGYFYLRNQGEYQSYPQAIVWFRKAADQGQTGAQVSIGYMYESGQGVQKNEAMAMEWYYKALEGGDKFARSYIERLEGVIKNRQNAELM